MIYTKEELRLLAERLDEVKRDLEMFLRPDDDNCSVSPEARQEASLFLTSYVLEPLNAVIESVERRQERNARAEALRKERATTQRSLANNYGPAVATRMIR